jgi:hypothetical protein
MSWISTGVVRKRTMWAVQVESSEGEQRELKYRSEAQARYFAAVLALGPSRLPVPPKARIARKLGELPRSTDEAVELLGS